MKTPEFMKKRRSNMTLEKLLIFGFALAVLLAISTMGANLMTDRSTASDDLESKFGDIAGAGG